jgi:hypothetical protein
MDSEMTVSATGRSGDRKVGNYVVFWTWEKRAGKLGVRRVNLVERRWSPAGMPGDPPFMGVWIRQDDELNGFLDADFYPNGTAFLRCHGKGAWFGSVRWKKLDASHLQIERNGTPETWRISRQRYLPDGAMYEMSLVDGTGREYTLRR